MIRFTCGHVCGGIVFIVNCVEGTAPCGWCDSSPGKVVLGCIRKLDVGLCESQQTVFLHLFCHKLLLVFLPWLPSVADCALEAAVQSCLFLSCSGSVSYPSNRNEARTTLCSAHTTVNSIMTSSYLLIFCPYHITRGVMCAHVCVHADVWTLRHVELRGCWVSIALSLITCGRVIQWTKRLSFWPGSLASCLCLPLPVPGWAYCNVWPWPASILRGGRGQLCKHDFPNHVFGPPLPSLVCTPQLSLFF